MSKRDNKKIMMNFSTSRLISRLVVLTMIANITVSASFQDKKLYILQNASISGMKLKQALGSGFATFTYNSTSQTLSFKIILSSEERLFSNSLLVQCTNLALTSFNQTTSGAKTYSNGTFSISSYNNQLNSFTQLISTDEKHQFDFVLTKPINLSFQLDSGDFFDDIEKINSGFILMDGKNQSESSFVLQTKNDLESKIIELITPSQKGVSFTLFFAAFLPLNITALVFLIQMKDGRRIPVHSLDMAILNSFPLTGIGLNQGSIFTGDSGYTFLLIWLILSVLMIYVRLKSSSSRSMRHISYPHFFTSLAFACLMIVFAFYRKEWLPYINLLLPINFMHESRFQSCNRKANISVLALIASQGYQFWYLYYYGLNSARIPIDDPEGGYFAMIYTILIGFCLVSSFLKHIEESDSWMSRKKSHKSRKGSAKHSLTLLENESFLKREELLTNEVTDSVNTTKTHNQFVFSSKRFVGSGIHNRSQTAEEIKMNYDTVDLSLRDDTSQISSINRKL